MLTLKWKVIYCDFWKRFFFPLLIWPSYPYSNMRVRAGTLIYSDTFSTKRIDCELVWVIRISVLGFQHISSVAHLHTLYLTPNIPTISLIYCLPVYCNFKSHYFRRVQGRRFSSPCVSSLPPNYWIIYLLFKWTCPKLRLPWLFLVILE